jgi:quercetin dioxygenase-like cupin family protein
MYVAADTTYTRIYATPDGNSHFEDVTVEMHAIGGDAFSPSSETGKPVEVTDFNFRRMRAGADSDWHPAPRRQFVIVMSGTVEIEASDGEVRRFGPASMFFADDTMGKHRTRPVGDDAVIVAVPLADQNPG